MICSLPRTQLLASNDSTTRPVAGILVSSCCFKRIHHMAMGQPHSWNYKCSKMVSSKAIGTSINFDSLSGFGIPVMPLTTLANLQSTLSSFQKQLYNSRLAAASIPRPSPVITLLPYCSNNPLPEHARNVLSDLVHSIPDLAQAATTRDGQTALRQWFSGSMPHVAEDVVAFWEQEFIVD